VTRLVTRRDGAVCYAILTEPDKLNPLSDELREELFGLVANLEEDLSTRVVVLSGAGRAFSGGADLRGPRFSADRDVLAAAEKRTWSTKRRGAGAWQRLLDRWEALPQVTIARLKGAVVGGAVLLAAACDLRVAADDLALRVPEVAVGVPLSWAGIPRLVREIGLPRTRDLLLTARGIDAATASDWGFVTRVATVADLDTAVDALVREVLGMPDAPLYMTKDALAAVGREHPSLNLGWADADLIVWAGAEPESREATQRYKARRL
jgi:enoyl-CoA hydratase/carnithine racemase